jgi:hypothetical protein
MNLARLPSWAYWLAAILPIVAVVGLAVVVKPGLQIMTVIALAFVVWGLAFGGMAWRRLDETSREAQKSASLWGSSFGLLALLIACAVAMTWPSIGDPINEMIEQMSAKAAHRAELLIFGLGVVAASMAGAIGYAIVWAGWWLAKRR